MSCWGPGNLVGGNGVRKCVTPAGNEVDCYPPTVVPGSPFASFDVDHLFAVGITQDGAVVAWGDATAGRLGDPNGGGNVLVPTPVPGLP